MINEDTRKNLLIHHRDSEHRGRVNYICQIKIIYRYDAEVYEVCKINRESRKGDVDGAHIKIQIESSNFRYNYYKH